MGNWCVLHSGRIRLPMVDGCCFSGLHRAQKEIITKNNYQDTSSATDGWPSANDVNVKWFDAYQDDDISKSQYDKIVDKYNECYGGNETG